MFRIHRCDGDVETLKTLEHQHPYSEYNEKAKLMSVYASYRIGHFDDAILAADRYVALFPGSKEIPYVLSGMVRNEQTIIGQGSIFNVPSGSGRVIAFTFDPLHRYLNHHDAPLVWNVLINWDHLKGK